MTRDRIIEALDDAAPADRDPLNHAIYAPAVEALIAEAVDEALERAALTLDVIAAHPGYSRYTQVNLAAADAAHLVRSHKGATP
jgi:hypothetical protein